MNATSRIDRIFRSLTGFAAGCRASPGTPRRILAPETQRAAILLESCLSVRMNLLESAVELLSELAPGDPARLNLMGAVYELRRNWSRARNYYAKACAADRHFKPARQNMRRLSERIELGACSSPIVMGDEEPLWWDQWNSARSSGDRMPARGAAV